MVRNKIRLTKSQVEWLKVLVNTYGDTKSSVKEFIRMVSSELFNDDFGDLNYFNHETIRRALTYGYEVTDDWTEDNLEMLGADVKEDLLSYSSDLKYSDNYQERKEVFLEIKNRLENKVKFNIFKSLNEVDLDDLKEALELNDTECMDFWDCLQCYKYEKSDVYINKNKRVVFGVNDDKKQNKKTPTNNKDIVRSLELDVDYLLSQLSDSLKESDKELRKRTLLALEEVTENLKKVGNK